MSSLGLNDENDAPMSQVSDIPTYIVPSAISILFCGLLGIIATVYSAKTISANNRGDLVEAERHSNTAKGWMIAAYILGILGIIGKLAGSR